MVKLYCSDALDEVADRAVQIHVEWGIRRNSQLKDITGIRG